MSDITTGTSPTPARRLSVPWWAQELGVSERTLWKRIAMKELRSSRVGRRVIILQADMDTFLRRGDDEGRTNPDR